MPDCNGTEMAKRSYPTSEGAAERRYPVSEVRGTDERSYPTSEVRGGGREEIPQSLSPRPGVAAGSTNPTPKEPWLRGRRRAKQSCSMYKVRWGGHKEIPLVQGKEQWLRYAGAAVKRYPTSKVRETQVRR